MSIEQANAFRTFVNENESLQEQIRAGLEDGSLDPIKLAAEHGYEVTLEDGVQMNASHDNGELELSEFELDMVSGGWDGQGGPTQEFFKPVNRLSVGDKTWNE